MKGSFIFIGTFFRGPPQKNIQANAWAILSTILTIGFKSAVLSSTSSLYLNVLPLIGILRARGSALSRK